ncbi:hypothetical protein NHQ30_008848 [Ciborinia camelliae]|nr:hypothetical protein NHQ30_008848 [Ciborinia camelliae]
MGLPMFFEPSKDKPDSESKSADKTSSRTRSTIRRRYAFGNESRAAYNARRRRAFGLDLFDEDYCRRVQNLARLGNAGPAARIAPAATTGNAMRGGQSPILRNSTSGRRSIRSMEANRPSIPATSTGADEPHMHPVPESRDYSNPRFAFSFHRTRRVARIMALTSPPHPPYSDRDPRIISRMYGLQEERLGGISPSGILRLSNPAIFNRDINPNTALAERVDGMSSQDSYSHSDYFQRPVRERVATARQNIEDRNGTTPQNIEDRNGTTPQNIEDRNGTTPQNIEDRNGTTPPPGGQSGW